MPTALPIARLLASPRRSEAASSPCAAALVATVANAPNTSARSTDRSSKALGVVGKQVERAGPGPVYRQSNTQSAAHRRFGEHAGRQTTATDCPRSGRFGFERCTLRWHPGTDHCRSANSSLSIWRAMASLTAAVLYTPSRRIIRLAWSHPGTVNVAATHIAAYISFGVEASRAISAKDVNTPGGSIASGTAPQPPDSGETSRWAAAGPQYLAARLPPIAAIKR